MTHCLASVHRLVVLLALLLGAGCAGLAPMTVAQTDEERVEQRANARWQALVDGRFDLAYEFASPAFREIYTARGFRGRFGQAVAWTAAEVTKVEVEGDAAKVMVFLSYTALDASGAPFKGGRPIREQWIRVDGEWWHSSK